MTNSKDNAYLRDALRDELIKRVEEGETVANKDGDVSVVSAPASTLQAAIAFLKLYPADDVPATGDARGLLSKYRDKIPDASTT